MNRAISISGRPIGPDHPPYIIAELSANHNGSLENAMAIVHAANDAGADAVKLQTYTPDTMTINHASEDFKIRGGLWDGYFLYDLYREAHMPWEWHEKLIKLGNELGLTVFSTPFDESAVDLLDSLGVPAFKIASFEANDLPLIRYAASKGKPLIISTGMARLGEIEDAVTAARQNGAPDIILLHCVSAYPAPAEESNLLNISHLAETFDVVTGLSDHTLGTTVPSAAVALGACLIEKHFTLRRSDGGPDSAFSLEPPELKQMVENTRVAWAARGHIDYQRTESERGSVIFRRSLYVVADVSAGEKFTTENIRSIRPGYGLAPKYAPDVIGRQATRDLRRGTPLDWMMVH